MILQDDWILEMDEYINQYIKDCYPCEGDDGYDGIHNGGPIWAENTPDWIKNLPDTNYRRNPNCFREQLEIFHQHGIFFPGESDII